MLSRLFRLYSLVFPDRAALGQFFRFAVVGATNTTLDFAIYLLLTRGFPFWSAHFVLAAAASFTCAVISSFVLNTLWTFRADFAAWRIRAPKFLLVALVGLALNSCILALLVFAGLHDILAKLIATGIVVLWNFTMQRNWTFGIRT